MQINLVWFQHNLTAVLFVYGLLSLVMSAAIWVQPKQESKFFISRVLWLLSVFGSAYGVSELLEMWAMIIEVRNPYLDLCRGFILIISHVFLFEFGRQFFSLCRFKTAGFRKWLTPFLTIIILVFGLLSHDFWNTSGILARYLLGLPGALLSAYAFWLYYRNEEVALVHRGIRKYFRAAVLPFFVYAVLGGLIVPNADFFPANLLNAGVFLKEVKIPVTVFDGLCVITSVWAAASLLKIFNWETVQYLRIALEEREKITEGIQEGIMLIDKDFSILWANQAIKKLYGNNIIGNRCYRVTHNRDTPCQFMADICPVFEALKTGNNVSLVHTHSDAQGKSRFIEVSVYLLKDETGKITEFVHISRDVTERRKKEEELREAYLELERMQGELIQSAKLAEVGVLASGVAHEVRNPLAVVMQGVNYLENKLGEVPQPIFEILNLMKENIKRSDKIIHMLLDFSHKEESNRQKEDINSVIESSLELLQHKIKSGGIEIIKQLQIDLPRVFVDRSKIEQVLVNILVNAIQATPNTGKIFLRSYLKRLKEIDNGIGRRKNDYFALGESAILVEVEDTGIGISKDNIDRIFVPFFSTKGPQGGTGLGLSVSRNIMLMHRGLIKIASEEGQGTKVSLVFKIKEG